MTVKDVKLTELIEDEEIYPRHRIDSVNISKMVDAMEAGQQLPPIVVDPKKRIVDGVHRYRAFKRHLGPEATIKVEIRRYSSEAELFQDAVTMNSKRGLDLSPFDRVRCMELGERYKIPVKDLASLLGMSPTRLQAIRDSRMGKNPKGKLIPLKRTIRHMVGETLTERQTQANDRLSGMSATFYVNQVVELLDSDLMERDEEHLAAVEKLIASATQWLQSGSDMTKEA